MFDYFFSKKVGYDVQSFLDKLDSGELILIREYKIPYGDSFTITEINKNKNVLSPNWAKRSWVACSQFKSSIETQFRYLLIQDMNLKNITRYEFNLIINKEEELHDHSSNLLEIHKFEMKRKDAVLAGSRSPEEKDLEWLWKFHEYDYIGYKIDSGQKEKVLIGRVNSLQQSPDGGIRVFLENGKSVIAKLPHILRRRSDGWEQESCMT